VLYVIAATCGFFFSACLLTGAPGGSKAGFPTEAVDFLLFCFYRCSSWLSGFSLFVSFYFCSVSLKKKKEKTFVQFLLCHVGQFYTFCL